MGGVFIRCIVAHLVVVDCSGRKTDMVAFFIGRGRRNGRQSGSQKLVVVYQSVVLARRVLTAAVLIATAVFHFIGCCCCYRRWCRSCYQTITINNQNTGVNSFFFKSPMSMLIQLSLKKSFLGTIDDAKMLQLLTPSHQWIQILTNGGKRPVQLQFEWVEFQNECLVQYCRPRSS